MTFSHADATAHGEQKHAYKQLQQEHTLAETRASLLLWNPAVDGLGFPLAAAVWYIWFATQQGQKHPTKQSSQALPGILYVVLIIHLVMIQL